MSDVLIPLKKDPKQCAIASFDVETSTSDNDFYLVGVYSQDGYRAFYTPKEFYDYCKTYLRGYKVVATNLGFDITSAFLNTKYWNEFDIISNGGYMLMAYNRVLDISFIDTLNYHKASVKELGKIVGFEKLEAPSFLGKRKPKNPLEECLLREYNERDCLISYKFMDWFQQEVNKLGGELKITIASTSLDIWKRQFNKYTLVKEDYILGKRGQEIKVKDKIFKAYYGGRTEVLQRGSFSDLNYYDFNSLYPSVMINSLPFPNSVQYHEKGSLKELKFREGVSCVTIEHFGDELPLLPYRSNGKLLFPSGKFKGWYTHIELRTALKHNYILHEVHETISYSLNCKPFYNFVNVMYEKRKQAKLKGSNEQLIYKLLMNSLYGKFGERKHNVVKHFDLNEMTDNEIKTLRSEHFDKEFNISDDKKGYFSFEEECTSSHVFPIFPVYISALGRIKLWNVARLHNPVYMDTDSIITKDTLNHSKELGDLDLEYKIKNAIFIKPKMYFMKTDTKQIVRMKGVPRADLKQFEKVIIGESIYYTKFVKLKEGIRRNLKVNSVYEMEKHLDLEDNKRKWEDTFSLKSQSSKPLIIENDEIQNKSVITPRGYVSIKV